MPNCTFSNGTDVAVCITTTVTDGTTRGGLQLYENSGQASGRQSIDWYNGGNAYYKARLWTQVGSGYNETTFGIDVADNARTLDTRLIIQNGNVGIGTISPTTRLQVNGDASIISANNASAGRSSYMRFANTADSTTAYFGLDGGGLVGNENGATLVGSSTGKSILFAPALTERMRVTSCGAMYMSRISSNLTFPDNVGGMYVRQNGNGAGTEEELRIFGRNISIVSHTGTRYMDVTSTGNVGIGTTAPSDKLHILGADNGITICASASNRPVLSLYSAANLMLKLSANSTFGAIADNSGSDVMYFKGGCVSIGTSTPSYKLHVNGTFYAAGSSQDYKQSICNYNTDSCMFMKLKPVTYQYKEEWCHLGKELKSETQIGLIAEDVAEVYPELAILVNEDDQKIVRNVDYEKLSIVLLSEVQKLRKELDELKTK